MKVHNLSATGSLITSGEDITRISSSVAATVNALSSSLSSRFDTLQASTGSLNAFTSSTNNRLNSVESTTGSLNTYTGSNNTRLAVIESTTGSINIFTSSASGRLNSVEGKTGSYATTGSNTFVGLQTIQGSIVPGAHATYDLGSAGYNFRHLYLSSASLYIDGTKVLGSTAQELQITTDAGQSFKILEAGSDTITLQSADGNITLATSGGGDVILDPTTGIIALKGTTTIYAGNKVLSSDGNAIQFGNSVTMTGSLIVTGYIETQELRTTYISSSILYRSGSTKFGDELTDTHTFSGSVSISGSLSVPDSGLVSGSSQILNGTTIHSGSFFNGISVVSGSAQIDVLSTTNAARIATTGSNSFTSNQTITGSLTVTGSLTNLNGGLVVSSSANMPIELWHPDGNGIRFRNAGASGKRWDIASSGDNFVINETGVSGRFFISSSGYFGLNTTSPIDYLTIPVVDGGLYITGSNRSRIILNTPSAGWQIETPFGNSNGLSGSYSIVESGAALRFTILKGGNTGINKSNPNTTLDVNGNALVTGSLTTTSHITTNGNVTINNSNVGRINLGNTTGTSKVAGAIIAQTSPSYSATGKLGFSVTTWGVNTDYDLTEVMAIDMRSADTKGAIIYMNPFGGGRLGVGTQNPTEMLHISGSGSATAIKVETATNHATFFEASTFTGTTVTRLQSNSSAGFVGTMTAHPFDVFAGGSFTTRYNTNGNVNVGYQGDQGAKLYVQANLASYAAYFEQVGGATSSYGGVRITTNSTGVNSLYMDNAGTQIFSVKGSGVSYISNALGIGYTDPQYSLQVNGSIGLRANSQNIKAITGTGWGYSVSSYKVVMLGDTANNVTVSIGYDPSGNANSAFTGDGREVLFRNGAAFATPNAANTSFNLNTLVLKDGKVGFGTADPGYTVDSAGPGRFVSNSSARVLYLKQNANNSGNIIQFQNESGSDVWEVVGRNNQFYVYNTSQSAMSIYVAPSTNNVGIGSSTTDHRLDVNGNIRINQTVAYLYFTATTTNRYLAYNGADTYWRSDGIHYFEKTSGYKGTWDASSNLTVNGTITESSALRYKENINPLENSLDKVSKLRGVSYVKKETGLKEFGFIAEEVNEIIPELVLRNPEGEIESVAYGRFVSVLAEAIKELKAEIEVLKQNK